MTPYRPQPRAELMAEYHARLAAYHRGEYTLEQLARLELIAFCQRSRLRQCWYCRSIDESTVFGSHCCASHYAKRRMMWF